MIMRVSSVNGTAGSAKSGNVEGNSPMSPTVGNGLPVNTAKSVSTMMATSGAGTSLVTYGNR